MEPAQAEPLELVVIDTSAGARLLVTTIEIVLVSRQMPLLDCTV